MAQHILAIDKVPLVAGAIFLTPPGYALCHRPGRVSNSTSPRMAGLSTMVKEICQAACVMAEVLEKAQLSAADVKRHRHYQTSRETTLWGCETGELLYNAIVSGRTGRTPIYCSELKAQGMSHGSHRQSPAAD